MLLKSRLLSEKLHYYHALSGRTRFTANQLEDFHTHFNGYKGEQEFVQLVKSFSDAIILWDLNIRSKFKGSAQFDVIIIHQNTVIHYDIKNYKGQFTMRDGSLVNDFGRDFKNPDHQLIRAHHILEDVVHHYDNQYVIESYIVFINNQFHLRGNTDNPRWLFRSILNNHLKKYSHSNFMLDDNQSLGHHLIKVSHPELNINPLERTSFSMEMIGLKCLYCDTLIREVTTKVKYYKCESCGKNEVIRLITFKSLSDLYYLKGEPFTITEAIEWCEGVSRASISRVLATNFKKIGSSRATKYHL
ncbi:nuclease-related domain-containing protein [Macrococcus lamae]|uniref:NERD domain-containing protein n=1 Tax=Macrococcus lamae TaxID=198484 RepID=A0A4R6BVE8_9STAP|nr:nuclease-related domain-containing protein [Macrococcus lamae]TDM12251.1 NERD domain-containing protein [Macrococcus lamae]